MADTDPNPTPPEHRRFSIRLPRPLWIAVVAGLLGVISAGLHVGLPIYRQYAAVEEIERRGGDIGGLLQIRRATGPEWLTGVLGEDLLSGFEEIDDVYFRANSESAGRRLDKLSKTHAISMAMHTRDGPSINDTTLSCLRGVPNLKRLSLRLCDVGDASMEHVCALRRLEELDLFCTDVSDAGMVRLETLPNLRLVVLVGTNVTDAGVAELQRKLPGLRVER